MNNPNYIEKGDWVKVFFENVPWIEKAEVLNRPCDVGDSWTLREADGTIHSVILFARITRIKEG